MFSLRYKISLVILLLLGLTLGGTFLLLRYYLKDELLSDLEKNLIRSAQLQTKQQRQHMAHLHQAAQALADSRSLQRVLQQPTHTSPSPILNTLMTSYPAVDTAWLYDRNGQLISRSHNAQFSQEKLSPQRLATLAQRSEQAIEHWLAIPEYSLYVLNYPLYLDKTYVGQLLLSFNIEQQSLKNLYERTRFDVFLFHQGQIKLHSHTLNQDKADWQLEWQQHLAQTLEEVQASNTLRVQSFSLQDRTWWYSTTQTTDDAPTYIFVRSIDKHLSIVTHLGVKLLSMSLVMLLLGLAIAWPLFRQITRAAQKLYQAAENIEKENYQYRSDIHSADEFEKLGKAFNRVMRTLEEREQLHAAMETLVSKELAEEMLKQNLHSTGEERTATVLFSGIRDFSHFVSTTAGSQLLAFLNNYFTRMDFCVNAEAGFIDKYFGDHLLALFGLNNENESRASAAIRAALDMEEALLLFNLEMDELKHTWKIGIGINTGRLVAGNVGAEDRRHYSVIGNPIRIAARLEKLCKQYGTSVLISQKTYESLQQEADSHELQALCRELDVVQLEKHAERMKIYQVLSHHQYEQLQNTDFLERFQQARRLLHEHDFRQALQHFQSLHEDWPEDKPTRLLLNRSRRYAQDNARYIRENPQEAYVLTTDA